MNDQEALLRLALKHYMLELWIKEIPLDYFNSIIETWQEMNQQGHNWNVSKAAAALLFAAVTDGYVHNSQVTASGYRAIEWAEKFLRKLDGAVAQGASGQVSIFLTKR